RRRDLQPPPREDAARHRRDVALRIAHSADAVDSPVAARQRQPLQHAQAARPAADADREPGTRLLAGGRTSGAREIPLLRAQAGSRPPLLHGELQRVPGLRAQARLPPALTLSAETRIVALLGHPVSHSLSPRMQNAAFAARGLDWAYIALDVPPGRLEEAVRGLVAGGFAGANVTIPHKQAAARLCDEADGDAVNTLVFA